MTRAGGVVAAAGGVLGLLWAPFFGAAYMATPDGTEAALAEWWSGRFREALPGAFDFDDPEGVYETFGLLSPLVIGALLAGVAALHRRQGAALRPWGIWTGRVFMATHALLVLGAAVSFYTPYLELGFLAGILPGMLLSVVGYVVYGAATVRARIAPRAGAWLMILGGLAFFPLSIGLGHNPLGLSVVYVAWIVNGAFLARAPTAA